MVRVLLRIADGKPVVSSGHYATSPFIDADCKPKWSGWQKHNFAWVRGKLVADRGSDLLVEIITPAGAVVFKFARRQVNLHGMVRPDELALLRECQKHRKHAVRKGDEFVSCLDEHMDHIVKRLGMHPKRAFRILQKWTNRGWWDFGVGEWWGWITPKGMQQ